MPRISIDDQRFPVGLFGPMGFFLPLTVFLFVFFVTGDVLFQWNFLSSFVCIIFRFRFLLSAFIGFSSSAFHRNFFLVICH